MAYRHRGASIIPRIAMSPTKLSTALDLDYRLIAAAIRSGELPAYRIGVKTRVLIEDAITFIHNQKKVRPHADR